MKVIFLDHDGVICLSSEWGSRHKKQKKWGKRKMSMTSREIPLKYRFDDFNKKAVEVLNSILKETDSEIVVSSDWRGIASLKELGEYYTSQGIIKKPIGTTKYVSQFTVPPDFPWVRTDELEQIRSLEILQWLKDHPTVSNWVAIDDLHMGTHVESSTWGPYEREGWGLENFVWSPNDLEGIASSGIKEKVINYLTC